MMLTAILVGSVFLWMFSHADAQMPPGGPQGPMPVVVDVVQPEEVRIWKEFPGRLVAVESAQIRPQVSGRITELHFEDGRRVEKGDLLFVIDPRPYEATLAQAQAALSGAQSGFTRAQKEFERAEELIKTSAVSRRIYDERRAAKDFAWAEIKGAKAAIQQAEINLDYAHVKAPISGRVSRAEITLGNVVEAGPNAPVVTTIVADEKIYADFEVDEQTYLSYVRGQAKDKEAENKIPVQILLRGGGEPIEGTVHAFDNRINPASGTIRARAVLENEDGALLPGMFARVRLGSAERQKQILIDEKALGTDQSRKFVYVVDENNTAAYRQVEIGDRSGQKRVVLSGLEPGDKVIAEGLIRIRPGMEVEPMEKAAGE
jgi:multidrug efflux system membrane fusion protein